MADEATAAAVVAEGAGTAGTSPDAGLGFSLFLLPLGRPRFFFGGAASVSPTVSLRQRVWTNSPFRNTSVELLLTLLSYSTHDNEDRRGRMDNTLPAGGA